MIEQTVASISIFFAIIAVFQSNKYQFDMKAAAVIGVVLFVLFNVSQQEQRLDIYKYTREEFVDQSLLNLLKLKSIQLDTSFAHLNFETSNTSSFTQNKNTIFICLKNLHGEYFSYDTLMNVVVHELAHVKSMNYDPNHVSLEFHDNLQKLTQKAIELDLINPNKIDIYTATVF